MNRYKRLLKQYTVCRSAVKEAEDALEYGDRKCVVYRRERQTGGRGCSARQLWSYLCRRLRVSHELLQLFGDLFLPFRDYQSVGGRISRQTKENAWH